MDPFAWIFANVNPDRGVQSRPERDEESVGRRVDRYRKRRRERVYLWPWTFRNREIIWEKFGQYVRVYGIWSNRVVDV